MDCERGGNYRRKNVSKGSYIMKLKCSFMLRSVPSGSSWKATVRCGFHNHILAKDLDDHNVLGHIKDNKIKFVNDVTRYNMTPRYIISSLKGRDPEKPTSVTHVYNAIYTCKTSKKGPLTEMQNSLSLIHEDKYMY